MKKRMITNLLLCAICTTALSQNLDRVFLGFHEIQSYPYCPMDTMVKTYAVVTDHFVPIAYKGPTYFIEDALAVNCRYRKEVASPDGADLVVSVNDYFEK